MEKENNNLNQTAIRIKQMRIEKGWTQKDLAKHLGLKNDTAIANYEAGYSTPKDEIKLKMCEIFNCSMDYLMGESNFKTTEESFKNYITIQNKKTILKTIDRYYDEYVIPCVLKEKDVDFLVNTLSIITSKNEKDIRRQLNEYINSYDANKKKKLKEFISIILKELANDVEDKIILLKFRNSFNDRKDMQNNNFYNIPIIGKIAAGQPIFAQEYIEGYLPVDPQVYGLSTSEDLFYLRIAGNSMNKKVKNGDYALIHKQDCAEDGDIIVAIVNGDDEATLKKYKKINDDLIALEPQSDDPSYEPIYIDKNTKFQIIGKAIGQFGKF